MGNIEKMVKERMQMIEWEKAEEESRIRFSVTLQQQDAFRLEYIAKRLETNRAALARDFILSALPEAEKALGLNPFDFESEYAKEIAKRFNDEFNDFEKGGK